MDLRYDGTGLPYCIEFDHPLRRQVSQSNLIEMSQKGIDYISQFLHKIKTYS